MTEWGLPEAVEVGGAMRAVRYDFRAVLDVLEIWGDPELSDAERGEFSCRVFYVDFDAIDPADYAEACERMQWFVGGGDVAPAQPKAKLADWAQDFPIIIAPVNRVLGFEARSVPYDPVENAGGLHWWTFLGAYMEVGDCLFAQVVAIRKKRRKGKRLEKHEEAFLRENRALVDFRVSETEAEAEVFDAWTRG